MLIRWVSELQVVGGGWGSRGMRGGGGRFGMLLSPFSPDSVSDLLGLRPAKVVSLVLPAAPACRRVPAAMPGGELLSWRAEPRAGWPAASPGPR